MPWQPHRWGTSSRGIMGTMLEGGEFRCSFCRGKGVLPSTKSRCPACSGRGLVKVAPSALTCAYCRGKGEVPARSGITCTVCRGKGVVTVQQPVELCPQCRGRGAAPNNQLHCLVCQGKGVVTTKEHREGFTKAGSEDSGWVAIQARRAAAGAIKAIRNPTLEIHPEAEPSPFSLQRVSLLAYGYGPDEEKRTGDICGPPQRRRETRMVSPGAVGGLVRRLMATERARILGRKAIDLGRYTLEKRTQRWRESRKGFK